MISSRQSGRWLLNAVRSGAWVERDTQKDDLLGAGCGSTTNGPGEQAMQQNKTAGDYNGSRFLSR